MGSLALLFFELLFVFKEEVQPFCASYVSVVVALIEARVRNNLWNLDQSQTNS